MSTRGARVWACSSQDLAECECSRIVVLHRPTEEGAYTYSRQHSRTILVAALVGSTFQPRVPAKPLSLGKCAHSVLSLRRLLVALGAVSRITAGGETAMSTLSAVAVSHDPQIAALEIGEDAAKSVATYLRKLPRRVSQRQQDGSSLLRQALDSGEEGAVYEAVLAVADSLAGKHRAIVAAVRLARAAVTVDHAFSLASSAVMPDASAETQLVIAGCNRALAARLTSARPETNAPLVRTAKCSCMHACVRVFRFHDWDQASDYMPCIGDTLCPGCT